MASCRRSTTSYLHTSALCIALTCWLLASNVQPIEPAKSDMATTTAASTTRSTGSTPAYAEPIKWSFGGWAPLNGVPQRPNGTTQAIGVGGSATSPLPTKTTARPAGPMAAQSGSKNQTSGRFEALSESASSSHEKIQFAAPENHRGRPHNQGSDFNPIMMRENHPPPPPPHIQLQSGPAYTIMQPNMQANMQHPQQARQFSPPAPTPIVRDHLLPAANHNQAGHSHRQHMQQFFGLQQMHPHRQHHQSMQHMAAMQPHRSPMQAQRPDNFAPMHYQQMQQRHREHMMQQHNMAMRQHQQQMMGHGRPAMQHGPPMGQQPQMARPPYNLEQRPPANMPPLGEVQERQPMRSIPRYPGSPLNLHQQQQPQPQQHIPPVGTFKVIEGEQPIMFSHSLSNERVPTIQVGPRNMSSAPGEHPHPHPHQQQPHEDTHQSPVTPSAEQLYAPTLAAIEKDNLNYHNALQQVSSSLAEEKQQQQQQQQHGAGPSNNIQDIKQKQQYAEQQTTNGGQLAQAAPAKTPSDSKSAPSYLTIPVAVETEGDKVLTSDDINEIEKHVINVLPNLKTADKIVKIADAHLNLGNLKVPTQQHEQQVVPIGPAEVHQQNYQEHKSTMKQLENDLMGHKGGNTGSEGKGSPGSLEPSSPSYGAGSASTANAQHESAEQHPDRQQLEHQYFVATGPLQEVGTVDPDQVSDYNLIKNDLLNTFRYEPTRATTGHQQQQQQYSQQMGSTPPMQSSYSAQPSRPRLNAAPNRQRGPPTVTRYFEQGQTASTRPYGNNGGQYRGNGGANLFGRLRTPATATTKTILGGRKVSEVMRPLIHTTPVPMTTPMHMQSVEPEKVDAIQLIGGGRASDKQPIVVEAHQLVNHTPDGGIDYSSGAPLQPPQPLQNATIVYEPQQQQQQQQQQQYGVQDENQGAIIEYVALTDQALSNAISGQQQQPQVYEVSANGQPQHEMVYSGEQPQQQQQPGDGSGETRAPFAYDYTITTQHQQQPSSPAAAAQQGDSSVTPATAYVTMADQALIQAVQQHQRGQQPEAQPSLAWSPSVASEHQQQQMELSGHAAPMQQMEMPSTAGYNFFNQQEPQQQQQPQPDYEQQQQSSHEQNGRWRTKAGGSQPNPDAQYDGQIVRGEQQQEHEHDSNQHQHQQQQEQSAEEIQQQQHQAHYGNQLDLNRLPNPRPQGDEQQQQQQQSAEHENGGIENQQQAEGYQQQQQQHYQAQMSTVPAGHGNGQQARDDGYQSTSAYSAGAQMNHHSQNQAAPGGDYEQQQQQHQQPQQQYEQQQSQSPFNYVKLDRDRQQNHLAQQQAQHQAQLAEIMSEPPRSYQTTTPMTLTTLAAISEQQQEPESQQQQQQQQQQHEQQEAQNGADLGAAGPGYMVEQVQSRPTVQSQPESLLVNESPLQVPMLDQQSLIPDSNQDQSTSEEISDDDAAKQRQQSQPAGVYQVYQAYYAPKDHKPLPGYVRLSLEEFNELFRDAEIQYVDRNLNGVTNGAQQGGENNGAMMNQGNQMVGNNGYGEQASDQMRASASETQSILVDGRSITTPGTERRSSGNSTAPLEGESAAKMEQDRKTKLGQAVKKIISIRNSRQLAKQAKTSKLVMKRMRPQQQTVATLGAAELSSTTPYTTSTTVSSTTDSPQSLKQTSKQKFAKKKTTDSQNPSANKKTAA